jgi:hypothetical protein
LAADDEQRAVEELVDVEDDRNARRAPSFRAGDQSASAEGAFHTEGLKPVDGTSIS